MFVFNQLYDTLLSIQLKTSRIGTRELAHTHSQAMRALGRSMPASGPLAQEFRVRRNQSVCFRGTGECLNPVSQLNGGQIKALYTWGMAATGAGWGSEPLFSPWQITFLSRLSMQSLQALIRSPFSLLNFHLHFQWRMLKSRNRFLS